MLQKGSAKKVTIYVNEDTQYRLQPLYQAILTYLMHKGVAGATASRVCGRMKQIVLPVNGLGTAGGPGNRPLRPRIRGVASGGASGFYLRLEP